MSNKIWDDKPTDLTLNGPRLSITSDTTRNISLIAPNGQTGGGVTDQTSVTFSVTGVSTFPDGTSADGGISYEWFEINDGAIGVSTRFTGAGTSSLTLTHALSPEDNGKQYFSRLTFTPDNVSSGGTSGISLIPTLDSSPIGVDITPELFISAGITTATVSVDQEASFSCLGGINRDKVSSYDTGQESSIAYQWYFDGNTLSDGTLKVETPATTVTKTFGIGDHTLIIPDDALNVTVRVVGGAGGSGGNDAGSNGGSGGQGRVGKFSLPNGGRKLTINVGGRGNNGGGGGNRSGGSGGSSPVSRGGNGGNSGDRGSSGSGGGGAGGVFVFDSVSNGYIIATGGGGGAAGGSLNRGNAPNGGNAGDWQSVSSISGITNGSNGNKPGGDGGGGGGGGGGYRGGSGGAAGSDGGGGGGGPCFSADTRVLMWPAPTVSFGDLVERPISEVKVGDYVINKDRTSKNKVTFIEEHNPSSKDPDLYSPNENIPPFATTNHPLFVDGEWVAVDVDLYPWLGKQRPLRDASIEETGNRKLYNLWLSGDGTYNVNGFGTHSIMFDGGFMKNCFAQGLLTHDEVMSLMRSYTYGETDLVTGAFLLNKLLGKVNLKVLNKFVIYCLRGNDTSKRKKIIHKIMKLLQRRFK